MQMQQQQQMQPTQGQIDGPMNPPMSMAGGAPINEDQLDPQMAQFLETNQLPTNGMPPGFPGQSFPDQQQQQQLQQQLLMLQQQQQQQQGVGMPPQIASIPPSIANDLSQMDQDPDAISNVIPSPEANQQLDYQQKMDKMQFQADQGQMDFPSGGVNGQQYGGGANSPYDAPVASGLIQYGGESGDANMDSQPPQKMGKLLYQDPRAVDPTENIKRRLKTIEPSQLLQQSGLYANNPNPASSLLSQRNAAAGVGTGALQQNGLWRGRQYQNPAWGQNVRYNAMPALPGNRLG